MLNDAGKSTANVVVGLDPGKTARTKQITIDVEKPVDLGSAVRRGVNDRMHASDRVVARGGHGRSSLDAVKPTAGTPGARSHYQSATIELLTAGSRVQKSVVRGLYTEITRAPRDGRMNV